MNAIPNPGKNLLIEIENETYARYPLVTHLISETDDIVTICNMYTADKIQTGDLLFISERIVAITQGRAFPISTMTPGWLAKKLSRYVHKSKHGIGLGSPWTMQLAIQEAGTLRILFAATLSVITKLLGFKGVFYHVVGKNINAIDGPCDNTIPPFNEYAKLGPKNPDAVACELKKKLGVEVVIIDANDLGVNVLGRSSGAVSKAQCKLLFRDNPLGQSKQQTPLCIVRKTARKQIIRSPFKNLYQMEYQ